MVSSSEKWTTSAEAEGGIGDHGGLGNLIDRVNHGGNVTDFLNVSVGLVRTGIFNGADMALMLGVALPVVGDRFRARLPRPTASSTRGNV